MIDTSVKDLKKYFQPEFLVYFFVCLLVISRGLLYELDSYAFLSFEINRSPGYLLFISFFKKIFGSYFEYPLLLVQLALNICGVANLHSCLKKIVKFQKLFSFLSLLILLAPMLYLYYTANKLLTEALAYPLYLLFIAHSLYGITDKEKKNFIYGALILLVLVFVRGQFLSLVPVSLIVILYMFKTTANRTYALLGVAFLLIPFISNLLDKSFHYYNYDHFVATPFTGPSIGAAVFYVADKEDVALFDSKEEKEYFTLVKEKMDQESWTNAYANRYDSISTFSHFSDNYVNICNQTIHEYGLQYFEKKGLSSDMQYIATDNLLMGMYQPLLLDNFKEWLKLYIQNIKAALGNAKYLLLHIILFIIGILMMVKQKNIVLGKCIVFTTLCTFSNIALLAIATHSDKRYVFYNDWVLFVVIFVFIDHYFKTVSKEKN